MSNETKRDVLVDAVDALADAQASGGNIGHQDANLFMAEYEKALPDDMPVIPKNIGHFIKQSVYEDATLQEALECAHDKHFGVGRWVSAHSEIFASAWVLGVWRIEETGEIVKLEAEK